MTTTDISNGMIHIEKLVNKSGASPPPPLFSFRGEEILSTEFVAESITQEDWSNKSHYDRCAGLDNQNLKWWNETKSINLPSYEVHIYFDIWDVTNLAPLTPIVLLAILWKKGTSPNLQPFQFRKALHGCGIRQILYFHTSPNSKELKRWKVAKPIWQSFLNFHSIEIT